MRNRSIAFTLIELLVVVAILSILVAMLLPALQGAKDSAKMAQCISNIRHWGTAISLFTADADGRFPVPCWSGSGMGWEDEVQPYIMPGLNDGPTLRFSTLVPRYKGVLCPEGQKILEWTRNGIPNGGSYYLLNYYGQTHQHDGGGIIYNGCYSYNYYATYSGWMVSGQLITNTDVNVLAPYCFKQGRHKWPAETALLIEGGFGGASGFRFVPGQVLDPMNMAHREFRHRRGTQLNVLFFDGHVGTYTDKNFPPDASAGPNSRFYLGSSDGLYLGLSSD